MLTLSKVDRSNIRRRIMVGMIVQNVSIPALATYLRISPKEITALMTDTGTFSWVHPAPDFANETLLERCAKLLHVPVDVLMPWSDPLPLVNDLMPKMTLDYPREAWRRPTGG